MEQLLGDIVDPSRRQKIAETMESFMTRQADMASKRTITEAKSEILSTAKKEATVLVEAERADRAVAIESVRTELLAKMEATSRAASIRAASTRATSTVGPDNSSASTRPQSVNNGTKPWFELNQLIWKNWVDESGWADRSVRDRQSQTFAFLKERCQELIAEIGDENKVSLTDFDWIKSERLHANRLLHAMAKFEVHGSREKLSIIKDTMEKKLAALAADSDPGRADKSRIRGRPIVIRLANQPWKSPYNQQVARCCRVLRDTFNIKDEDFSIEWPFKQGDMLRLMAKSGPDGRPAELVSWDPANGHGILASTFQHFKSTMPESEILQKFR